MCINDVKIGLNQQLVQKLVNMHAACLNLLLLLHIVIHLSKEKK